MTWRSRLEGYVAEARSNVDDRRITVSAEVMESARKHELRVIRTSRQYETIAKVRSASSGSVYLVELYVDESEIFPSFPFVWKCSCKWARERFAPCSHVIAVALFRGRRYDHDDRTIDRLGEENSQLAIEISEDGRGNHGP